MKSYPDSPENTPPPTPTAPPSGSQHSGKTTTGSLGNGSAGQDSAKTKQRKRKKVSDFFCFLYFYPFFFSDEEDLVEFSSEIGKMCCFSHNSNF